MAQHSCCSSHNDKPVNGDGMPPVARIDYLFWSMLLIITFAYMGEVIGADTAHDGATHLFLRAVFDLVNQMWWGVAIGVVFVGLATQIPRAFIMSAFGAKKGMGGILRATFAGVMLDLCSHGILMVGAKLYERGISNGQLMAFLIASPWNSFSLTLILISMIGLKWTLLFIVLSMVVGVITGLVFDALTEKGVLPASPYRQDMPENFHFWREAKTGFARASFGLAFWRDVFVSSIKDSRMVLRWLLLGIVLTALIRAFMDTETLATYFGPTILGLAATLVAATLIEVCSEGATPMAADLVTRAGAPGNGFTFLMAGVATDYTELMVLREISKSVKFTLFLPLITVPQVLVLGFVLNQFSP